ncbi:MAG: DNA polymerase III subunit delta [Candidatus Cloacimonetes bacterium]|nr:DNA polymerase III subunit delta [Candidatus Cloacimonadota bacterium]
MNSFKSYASIRLFYIFGNDDYQKNKIIELLKDNYTQPETRDFDAVTLYGDSCQGSEIIEHLETLPFMAPLKFLLIKDFDNLKKHEKNLLEDYCQNPLKSSVLVMVAEKVDNRTTLLKLLNAKGVVVECKKPYNSANLLRWLDNELRTRNLKMDKTSRDFLVNNVELSFQAIEQELEKLHLYTHGSNTYTLSDVETTLGAFRENNIYDLQNALGDKNIIRSLTVLQNMIAAEDTGVGVMLVAMLTRYFLILWKVLIYKQNSYTNQEIKQNHLNEVFYSFREDYVRAAEKYSTDQIKQIFSHLLQADTDLKSININDITLFLLIYKICRI